MKIGKAKYGATKKQYFKIKDGDNHYRILPPLGNLADRGVWSVFYKVHYGYKNMEGKLRAFQSSLVINSKTKMVESPDAADQRIKELKAKLEEAKLAGNKAAVEKLFPLIAGKTPIYNLDSNHYMNVIDTQGNIGVLKIRHRAKQALDNLIKKMREKGVDPLSVDNGRFFTFTRSGKGLDTTYAVEVMTETINVPNVGEVKREVVHKLTDDLLSRLEGETVELDKLFKAVSSEDIETIVKNSDLMTGKSSVIDEILGIKSSASSDDSGDEGYDEDTMSSGQVSTSAGVSAMKAETATVLSKPAKQEDLIETVLSTPKTSNGVAESISDMSVEDFMSSLQ